MSEHKDIRLSLTQLEGYAFRVDFGEGLPDLLTDEPAPLGEGRGPNPSKLLLLSLANCLAASLSFALRKFRNAPGPFKVEVMGRMERNPEGRWRIPRAFVEIHMAEGAEAAFAEYVYLRDNPAGVHRELWFHEQGDRSWLIVTRDTVTHRILGAELARDVKLKGGAA